jgi:hypothetical protein
MASTVGVVVLLLWLPQLERASGSAEVIGYAVLSFLLGYLFLQAIWSHLFRISFFALVRATCLPLVVPCFHSSPPFVFASQAPAYIVGGVVLFHKALAFFAHETCGAALPVALTASFVLFYAHRWDCTKAVGAYLLWKALSCFSVNFYSLPTFFSFVYWWTSSLAATVLSAVTVFLESSSSSTSSSSSSPSSPSSSAHLSMPWATLDALVLLYFAGVAVTAAASALASLSTFLARRHLPNTARPPPPNSHPKHE